ncbi:MAG: hypothetical protein OEZ27_03510 [Nitrospinota bacterium]|nr:hypothetical protein [Nitrospinota bacterium]
MKIQITSKFLKLLKTPFSIAIIVSIALTGCGSTQETSKKKILWPSNEEKVTEKKQNADNEELDSENGLMPAGRKLIKEDFTLTLIDQEQADGDIDQFTLQHPLSITERQVALHMVALNYEKYSKPNIANSVFTKEDIKKTKRLLTKALNKAHPKNIIGFEVTSETGTTRGQLFASRGVLHWRFFKIQGVWYSKTRNEEKQYGTWRMVPGNGQRFHKSNMTRGTRKWDNWIEAKINLPASTNLKNSGPKTKPPNTGTVQTAPSPSQSSPSTTIAPENRIIDLEEKLKFLKYLHQNQLIDKREYEQKRKDLLNQYL